ncbi:MAG: radical SAM protein [SAR202 cluster bacterium]|nr:radical SAM protein [SAR202 cluster bacterium]
MKILLIAPYVHLKFDRAIEKLTRADFIPSAALLYLAAVLRVNNYEPTILDFNNAVVDSHKEKYFDYCKKIVIDNLNKHKPDLVGINCLFSGIFADVLELAKIVKFHSPHSKIAIGGMHPTTFTKEILTNCNDIDYIAVGEGEKTMVALAASVKAKNENLLSSIKSFAYKDKDGVVRINRETNYIDDLDTLPMPAWDLINLNEFEIKMDHYYNPRNLPLKHKAFIFSSRACPLTCNFCDLFMLMGRKHRKRSPKVIVDEIEMLNKSYGINYFSFNDDNLTLNKAHILAICNEILKRKLIIMCDTPNGLWINSLREEVLAKMAEAGFVKVSIAIEHGDDYIRNKVIGKALDRKKIFEVAGLLKKHKIMTSGLFIMGFPEDTNETLQKSYDMIDELELDQPSVEALIPLFGTPLFKQVVKDKDKLLIDDWNLDEVWKTPLNQAQSKFVIKPYNMSVDDLYEWRQKFDKLQVKHWKTNIKQVKILSNHNIGPDSTGVFPRVIHGGSKSSDHV